MSVQARIEGVFAPLAIDVGFAATHLPSGASLGINPGTLFPMASVVKVPILVELFRQARDGRFRLTDRLPMPAERRVIGSGVMQKLDAGAALTVHDLAMLMIIISDNTATQMLLDLVGPGTVTAEMRRLGLAHIHAPLSLPDLFAHGYNIPPRPEPSYEAQVEAMNTRAMDYASLAFAQTAEGNTASATDMAALMGLIAEHRAGQPEDCDAMLAILCAQQLRDRVPRYLPASATANKTGSFRGVRNDAGLIRRGAHDIITFALFTFDHLDIPPADTRLLGERNALVNGAMAEAGHILFTEFGR
jgi:beta-lactamase class A